MVIYLSASSEFDAQMLARNDRLITNPEHHQTAGTAFEWEGRLIRRACYSDPGKLGRQNEDAWALPSPGVDEKRLGTLLAIADGTGGLPGGGQASQEAINYLQALYYAAPNTENLPDRLRQSVEEVNALNRLVQRKHGLEKGHLTTLVAAVIHTDQIWVANVGDSRAYLVQSACHQLLQLTEDHSGHTRNVKAGLVSEADLASRDSGIITRAIGLQDDCQVDIYHYTWAPGDRLVLCSDGLSHLTPEVIVSTTLDYLPEKASQDLVTRAIDVDGSDNCTALVAAWLLPDQFDSGQGGGGLASSPAQPSSLAPSTGSGPAQFNDLTPTPRLKLRSGIQLLLLGVLLGWLSAALLIILLGLSR
jgi:serine/threonine protein phosphatase PrpC